MEKLSDNKDYCNKFPVREDQVDFHVLSQWCKAGRYEDAASVGLLTLFRDLHRMISQGKIFNDENKFFQPWRLIDMMEKNVLDLLEELISKQNILSLCSCLEEMKQGQHFSKEFCTTSFMDSGNVVESQEI